MKRIFIFASALILTLSGVLYASDDGQVNQVADAQAAIQEKQEKAEPGIKTGMPEALKTDPAPGAETPPKTSGEQKMLSDLAITPYKSNPVAVKAVDKSITLFTDRIREKFSLWLSRSGKYLELMKDILKNKNLPEDIVFLSLIESGFNPYAYSVARAAGPWQFISSTAKKYGLVIDWWRDERRDPVKSTEAAANYLSDLYEMFGSWNLAMAAYNAGEGKILRALHRSKSDDYWALLKTRHIRSETKNYVPKFIAASMIAVNPEEFGFNDIEYHSPFNYDEVTISSPIDLELAAQCAGTTVEVIKELNPELRRWCTPPDMPYYVLRIPAGSKELFLENIESIPVEDRFTVETYTVKKGDTVNSIAKKTGVTVKAILALNSMDKVRPVKPGTEISIPPREKFELDKEDRLEMRKASYRKSGKGKNSKTKNKKVIVASLNSKNKKNALSD